MNFMLAVPNQLVYLGTFMQIVHRLGAARKFFNFPVLWNKGNVFSKSRSTFGTLNKGLEGFEEGPLQYAWNGSFGGRKYFPPLTLPM